MVATYNLVEMASAMEKGTKDKHESLLQGWDVLVSYDIQMLNALLKAQGQTMKNVETVPVFSVDQKNILGKITDTYTFNVTLSDITIEFLDTVAAAPLQVNFKMSGDIKDKGGDTVKFPDGVYLNIATTLAHVQGTISKDGTFKPNPGTDKAPGWIVATEPNVHNVVCINLQQNSLLNFGYSATTDAGKAFLNQLSGVSEPIAQHLDSAAGLSFCLAGVQHSGDAEVGGDVALQPTCFMMSLIPKPQDGSGSGVLCLYIAVEGGVSSPGNAGGETANLEFSPGGTSTNPIPKGSNSSVILNRYLVKDKLFTAGLARYGCTNIKEAVAGDNALALTFNLPSQTVKVPGYKTKDISWEIGAVSFDISTQQSTMSVSPKVPTNDANASPSISMTYGTPNAVSDWSYSYYNYGSKQWEFDHGQTSLDFACSGTYTWQQGQNMLSASSNFPSVYKVTPHAISGAWRWGETWSFDVPDVWKSIQVNIPVRVVSFPSVNYFLVTNILLPGQHIFNADNIVADVSNGKAITSGFAMPWDMILTGGIASPPEPAPNHTPSPNLVIPTPDSQPAEEPSTVERFRPGPDVPMSDGPAAPAPTDAPSDGSKSLEAKFWDTFFSLEDTTMMTDMYQCFDTSAAPEHPDPLDQVLEVAAKHGFEGVDCDKLGDLMGFSMASEIALSSISPVEEIHRPRPFNAFFTVVAPSFTIQAYSGVYKVNGDATDLLVVDPGTGAVTYKKFTRTPGITSNDDANNPTYTVTWATGSAETKDLVKYSVVFTSTVQPDGGFLQSFAGKSTSDGKDSDFNGTKLVPVPAYDIRTSGGQYQVTKPDDLARSNLTLDRITGEIVFQGERHLPTQKRTADGQTHIIWAMIDGTSYDVVFAMDGTAMAFTGTKNPTTGTAIPFAGKIPDQVTVKDISGWDTLGNANNVESQFFNLVQIVTLALAVYHFFTRRQKKAKVNAKEEEDMEKLSEIVTHKVTGRRHQTLDQVATFADHQLLAEKQKWKDILNGFDLDGKVSTAIETRIAELRRNGTLPKNGVLEELDGEAWNQVYRTAAESIYGHLNTYATGKFEIFTKTYHTFLKKLGLDSTQINTLKQDAIDKATEKLAGQLAGHDSTVLDSYSRNLAETVRLKLNVIQMNETHTTYTNRIDELARNITALEVRIDRNQRAADKLAERIKTTTGDKKKELEAQKLDLEGKIKRDAANKTKGENEHRDTKKKSTKLEKEIEDAKTEGAKTGKEATKIQGEILGRV
ncbi:hypothetical protein Dda_3745 [Drechslerella dactyloides]|uniref:Uncharacterized protein n=1 Tax=Drechslerella dactyloides TaxID=74499 RepID=A0AAD6IYI6_DREDA|nr:hypothetical protein Dda_3745 [Drechslerella dactyloides]